MYDAIDFHNTLMKMSNPDLITYEKETYGHLKDITISYIKFLKSDFNQELEPLMKEAQEDMFIMFLTIRDFMYRKNIEMPDRFPHKFLLSVLIFKTKKGLN